MKRFVYSALLVRTRSEMGIILLFSTLQTTNVGKDLAMDRIE